VSINREKNSSLRDTGREKINSRSLDKKYVESAVTILLKMSTENRQRKTMESNLEARMSPIASIP